MDEQIQRLVTVLGMCERLLRTPLPISFTRHTSRLVYMWANVLPFALYGAAGVATAPVSVVAAWAIMGIEDTGVQIEEAFDILPQRQYAEGMYAGVNDIRDAYDQGYPGLENISMELGESEETFMDEDPTVYSTGSSDKSISDDGELSDEEKARAA